VSGWHCTGITTLDGDCYADVAVNTTFKLLQLLDQPDIPVAVSTLEAVNPFPAPYRSQGLILDCLPILNAHTHEVEALRTRQLQHQPGQEFFAQLLLQQTVKVTVIATGELCAASSLLI
jgi:purine nucleosidase